MFYEVQIPAKVKDAVKLVKDALTHHKFGVLWELDVPAKLKEKNVQLETEIIILEVCNPTEAKRAIEVDPRVSYFLPCKIVVRQAEVGSVAGISLPEQTITLIGNPGLAPIAGEVGGALKRVLDEVAGKQSV